MRLTTRQAFEDWELAFFNLRDASHFQCWAHPAVETMEWYARPNRSRQLPVLLGQLHPIEAEREHVLIPVFVEELLVKVLVKLVIFLFVAVQTV